MPINHHNILDIAFPDNILAWLYESLWYIPSRVSAVFNRAIRNLVFKTLSTCGGMSESLILVGAKFEFVVVILVMGNYCLLANLFGLILFRS